MLLCLTVLPALAQTDKVSMSCQDEPLPTALRRLGKISDRKIMFTYEDVERYRVTGEVKNEPFESALQMLLSEKPLDYKIDGNLVTISLMREGSRGTNRDITGIVVDEQGEPLPGATITNVKGRNDRETFAVITDANGHFKLTLSSDVRQLEVSYDVTGGR